MPVPLRWGGHSAFRGVLRSGAGDELLTGLDEGKDRIGDELRRDGCQHHAGEPHRDHNVRHTSSNPAAIEIK